MGVSSRDFFQSTPREAGVINWVQFLRCPPPIICDGQKIVQNFSRFLTTFDFDREYLRNCSRYPKSERNVIDSDSSHVLWKKSSELWSTNKKVLLASIEPPKWIFRGKLHLGPQGVLPPQFFTRARDWPKTPSAHTNWDGGPQKNFNSENLKFGLKFSVLATITSGLVGVSPQNIFRTTCRETEVITCV